MLATRVCAPGTLFVAWPPGQEVAHVSSQAAISAAITRFAFGISICDLGFKVKLDMPVARSSNLLIARGATRYRLESSPHLVSIFDNSTWYVYSARIPPTSSGEVSESRSCSRAQSPACTLAKLVP